jgi:hypothetical protein
MKKFSNDLSRRGNLFQFPFKSIDSLSSEIPILADTIEPLETPRKWAGIFKKTATPENFPLSDKKVQKGEQCVSVSTWTHDLIFKTHDRRTGAR